MPSSKYWETPVLKLAQKTKATLTSNIGGQMRISIGMACFQMSHFHLSQLQRQLFYQYARPSFSNFFRVHYSTRIPRLQTQPVGISNRIRTERVLGMEQYNLTVAFSTRPKSERAKYQCGEDALYVGLNKQKDAVLLSIFDGVGGYTTLGIDPAEYSNLMAESCGESFIESSANLRRTFQMGYDKAAAQRIVGGSTAVLAKYSPVTKDLEILNLGDSKAIVFTRNDEGKFVLKGETTEQEHGFNCPYQLSYNHHHESGNIGDTPDKADQYFFGDLKAGDVVLLATDGLTDNLFLSEIIDTLNQTLSETTEDAFAEKASLELVKKAYGKCKSPRSKTPFAKKARGLYQGGKLDDITNIVAYIKYPESH